MSLRTIEGNDRLSPVGQATRGPIAPATLRSWGIPSRLWRVFILSGTTFLVLQVVVALDATIASRQGFVNANHLVTRPGSIGHGLAIAIAGGVFGYIGFCLLGVILALRGRGLASAIPVSSFVVLGLLFSSSHSPTPIGSAWSLPCGASCSRPWFSTTWLGAILDLTLVLIPILVATRVSVRRHAPYHPDVLTMVSVGVALAIVAMTYRTVATLENPPDLSVIAAVISYGLIAGLSQPKWVVAHALMATAAAGTAGPWLIGAALAPSDSFGLSDGIAYFTNSFLPLFGLTLSASLWQPVLLSILRLRDRPVALLAILNLLNVADACLTAVALNSNEATELNPLVRYGGLPGKVLLVAAASAILFRIRPRALLWPILALLLVLAYHLTGFFIAQ